MARATLSLCMIVKNEEKMLPGLLASVAGLWDELVVADSGSTDQTVALLTAAGAHVFPFVWCDDFAAARNATLAAATCEWTLFLDADERLTPALAQQIKELLADEEAGAATVIMRNDLPGGLHREAPLLRLFRNDPTIRFEHRIHEDVSATVRAALVRTGRRMRALPGIVQHLGYVQEVAATKDKKKRDLDLLEKSIQQDPQDYYCWYKILEQARYWHDRPLWQKTAARLAAQWEKTAPDLKAYPWSGELVALLVQGLFDDPAQALQWLDEHEQVVQKTGPWHFRRGLYLESLGKLEQAAAAFALCLAVTGDDRAQLNSVRPLLGLCRLAAAGNHLTEAAKLARQAATSAPRDPEALVALATFTGLTQGLAELHTLATDHARNHQESAIPLAQALLTGGYADLAQEILTDALVRHEEAALGLLTLAICAGQDLDMEINLPQEAADVALQSWLTTLWRSPQKDLQQGFRTHCPAIVEFFPWLPKWIQNQDV